MSLNKNSLFKFKLRHIPEDTVTAVRTSSLINNVYLYVLDQHKYL
jgi:hypothetical protein